ncbi:MAG: recombinase family protein [Candidatus Methanomethylophilaceae archaeon]|nr:recombinase family protein [Candidatus Methanomethylophilaceae archaeon]
MRAAIYVRVSTEEQAAEGYSLEAQRSVLEDYCVAEGWDVAEVYEDDGFSGRNDRRPAYRRMLSELDRWDVMVVIKMDRIHRNSRNFMAMMDYLDRNGKKFVSSTESLDTTNALGRFVVDMIQRIAQLESEQIGERTHMGMREKAESLETSDARKRTMGFTPPFGYRLDKGALVSDPEEMAVVRRIFGSYMDGETLDSICFGLNREGTLTRKGNAWSRRSLRNILHNPVYAGFMRWEDLLIRHTAEAVLTPGEFNAVQRAMYGKDRSGSPVDGRLIPECLFRRSMLLIA